MIVSRTCCLHLHGVAAVSLKHSNGRPEKGSPTQVPTPLFGRSDCSRLRQRIKTSGWAYLIHARDLGPPERHAWGGAPLSGEWPSIVLGRMGHHQPQTPQSPLKYLRGAARTGEAAVIVPACWGPRLPGLTLMRHCVWNLDIRSGIAQGQEETMLCPR